MKRESECLQLKIQIIDNQKTIGIVWNSEKQSEKSKNLPSLKNPKKIFL